jgi:hypothetical protein
MFGKKAVILRAQMMDYDKEGAWSSPPPKQKETNFRLCVTRRFISKEKRRGTKDITSRR